LIDDGVLASKKMYQECTPPTMPSSMKYSVLSVSTAPMPTVAEPLYCAKL
jgi:hypothetical protein